MTTLLALAFTQRAKQLGYLGASVEQAGDYLLATWFDTSRDVQWFVAAADSEADEIAAAEAAAAYARAVLAGDGEDLDYIAGAAWDYASFKALLLREVGNG